MSIEKFDSIGRDLTQRPRSSMFGVPCYKKGRRPFVMYYEDCLVCKLFDAEHRQALALPGARLFQPKANSRPMGNWVQLPKEQIKHWRHYAAVAYHQLE